MTQDVAENVILVHIDFEHGEQDELDEFILLAKSTDANIVDVITGRRKAADPKTFVGKGKAQAIAQSVTLHRADLVIFNHRLSPAQERNLEREFKARTIDRTRLILDIFASRARTFEGKLQVELAQLNHMSTRLVRGWTHLERQRGGIGLRGPGETQLETDRRLLAGRIKTIKKRLEKVRHQRELGRSKRRKANIPLISLVGYTNAGKSTLFNRIASADVLVEDKLFATLDPTLRKLDIPHLGPVILADTVGFISHLPHSLVDAFRATLEETEQADLLLHVIDACDLHRQTKMDEVQSVLEQIHAQHIPQLRVFNKIDNDPELCARLDHNDQEQPHTVYLSAQTGAGIDLLREAISQLLGSDIQTRYVHLRPHESKARAELYAISEVLEERIDEQGHYNLLVKISNSRFHQWLHALRSR